MSQANRLRRERNAAIKAADRARTAEYLAALQEDPRVIAHREANERDPEVLALIARDRSAQEAALRAAGYRRRHDGSDGVGMWDQPYYGWRIVHSVARYGDGEVWGHVSVSQRDGRLPGWEAVRDAQWIMYSGHAGVVVIAPETQHVNLAEVAHVWTCLTAATVPDFTAGTGTI